VDCIGFGGGRARGGRVEERDDGQAAGRASALAISAMFGMTVLMPLPRPSILVSRTGILYRCESARGGDASGGVGGRNVSSRDPLESMRQAARGTTHVELVLRTRESADGQRSSARRYSTGLRGWRQGSAEDRREREALTASFAPADLCLAKGEYAHRRRDGC